MRPKPKTTLAKLRIDRKLSGYALAKAAGTTPSHIARIEKGECSPGVELALSLASVLGTTVEELFRKKAA